MGVARGAGLPLRAGSGPAQGAPSSLPLESCKRDCAPSWVSLIQRLSRPFPPPSRAAVHSEGRERGKGL